MGLRSAPEISNLAFDVSRSMGCESISRYQKDFYPSRRSRERTTDESPVRGGFRGRRSRRGVDAKVLLRLSVPDLARKLPGFRIAAGTATLRNSKSLYPAGSLQPLRTDLRMSALH